MYAPITILAGLVALALGGSHPYSDHHPPCKPGNPACKPDTYACVNNPQTGKSGWTICDANGKEIFAGECPPKTKCYLDEANQSPYCM